MGEYVVSEEIKKLRIVQMDLLRRFINVCKKHHITYYAAGGTLLGAARHKGFIPWDDDIDVQMIWDDYQKLMDVAEEEFQYPYFLQTYRNELFGEVTCNRLRRSDTTGYTRWEYENAIDPNYNKGIYIDIFPMFPIPKSEEKRLEIKEQIVSFWRALRGWNAIQNQNAGIPTQYGEYVSDYLNLSKQYSISEIKQLYMNACATADGEFDEIGCTSFRTFNEKLMWDKRWFGKTIELPFEDMTVSCPIEYKKVLAKQYGDWKIPVFNGAYHDMYLWDTELSYTEKLK